MRGDQIEFNANKVVGASKPLLNKAVMSPLLHSSQTQDDEPSPDFNPSRLDERRRLPSSHLISLVSLCLHPTDLFIAVQKIRQGVFKAIPTLTLSGMLQIPVGLAAAAERAQS